MCVHLQVPGSVIPVPVMISIQQNEKYEKQFLEI